MFHSSVGGPGKITYTFSAKRMQIFAPRQASVGRASRRGERKVEIHIRSAENIYVDLPLP
jgi:hypothetical protein